MILFETITSANTAYLLRASPLPYGTLLPLVATLYMLEPLSEIALINVEKEKI